MIGPLLHLTLATLRRYAREERVVRSVVWPIYLTPLTLAITLVAATATRSLDRSVAVAEADLPSLQAPLEARGFAVVPVPDAPVAVDRGDTRLATDGATVWTSAPADATLELEAAVRNVRGSGWVLTPKRTPPNRDVLRYLGGTTLRPLAMLFVLYALVFSLGAISRDRDAEILDVELTLPLPSWAPVLARWIAAVALLVPAHALSVVLLQLLMPAAHAEHFLMRGTGAIAAAAAVGVAVAGGAGRRQGFSGPFAFGSILVAGAFATGAGIPVANQLLPIFTVLTDARGEPSLVLGLLSGPVGAWIHAWRERRAT